MNLLLPLVAALVSILILPRWSFYFDVSPKIVVILAGAGLALLLSRRWPAGDARLQWFRVILGFEALAILVSTLFSSHPWVSIYGSTWRRSGALVELAILILAITGAGQLSADRTQARRWLRITVLASLPVTIYGVLQYFGVDPLMNGAGYHFGEGPFVIVRPPSTLGHAAYFATYLLYVVFAGVELARMEVNRTAKALAMASTGLATFAIALSGTRAAMVGLVAGLLWVAIRQTSAVLNRRLILWTAIMAVTLATFYLSPAGDRLRARAFWSREDLRGGSRLLLWRDTLKMAGGRWIAGYGPETFSREFPKHESLQLARAYPDFYHESPHNIFLDALLSTGLVGLLALVALAAFGLFVGRGWMGGAFAAMLVSHQFTAFTPATELYFYLPLLFLVMDRNPSRIVSVPRIAAIALAVPLLGFAIYLVAGDALLGSAKRALDRGDGLRAGRLVDSARRWNAHADIYFSLRILNEHPEAAEYAMRAAENAPSSADDPQNAMVNLAAFFAVRNNAAGVERCLRDAIGAAPEWYKPHWLLARVLEQEGRRTEAQAEASAASERDDGKHPEVAQAFERLCR